MQVRFFHSARRCNSALLPLSDDRLSLLLQFRIELIRVEPSTTLSLHDGISFSNGVLHDNVDGHHVNFPLNPWTDAEWERFRAGFVRVLCDYWDGKFRLTPTEPWYSRSGARRASVIDCNLSVELVSAGAHHRYYIAKPRAAASGEGFRSFADATRRMALLTSNDLGHERTERRVRVTTPSGSERHRIATRQCTALHEFGHTLGLDHTNGTGNGASAYGNTFTQWMDIMGGGEMLTARSMQPWIRRLDRHLRRQSGHADADVRFRASALQPQRVTYVDLDPSPVRPAPPRRVSSAVGHH
ncbi:MAG: hypothetical protein JNL19_07795 [Burkholderiales bacterium]|nr:hypothetical protein [Burkholderiales bacterium]